MEGSLHPWAGNRRQGHHRGADLSGLAGYEQVDMVPSKSGYLEDR